MSVAIEKIVLTIGGQEINLTLQEAKELKDILNATLGEEKTTVVTAPYPYPVPYPVYPRPHYYRESPVVTWAVGLTDSTLRVTAPRMTAIS